MVEQLELRAAALLGRHREVRVAEDAAAPCRARRRSEAAPPAPADWPMCTTRACRAAAASACASGSPQSGSMQTVKPSPPKAAASASASPSSHELVRPQLAGALEPRDVATRRDDPVRSEQLRGLNRDQPDGSRSRRARARDRRPDPGLPGDRDPGRDARRFPRPRRAPGRCRVEGAAAGRRARPRARRGSPACRRRGRRRTGRRARRPRCARRPRSRAHREAPDARRRRTCRRRATSNGFSATAATPTSVSPSPASGSATSAGSGGDPSSRICAARTTEAYNAADVTPTIRAARTSVSRGMLATLVSSACRQQRHLHEAAPVQNRSTETPVARSRRRRPARRGARPRCIADERVVVGRS